MAKDKQIYEKVTLYTMGSRNVVHGVRTVVCIFASKGAGTKHSRFKEELGSKNHANFRVKSTMCMLCHEATCHPGERWWWRLYIELHPTMSSLRMWLCHYHSLALDQFTEENYALITAEFKEMFGVSCISS